ncbi:hypothetical protein [Variovorax sp. Sphag1AA]|uniref:hypothetical protein n=1 Tax=Variovorax sp. Sphag1AA TaxID=2587027 RepID=UPI001622FE3F|nr:hypothetical protein [Variovorax sp. Sphag1AA]MBB3175669.1 hypothetical protein [Variovorax sp. Sphag1AA]
MTKFLAIAIASLFAAGAYAQNPPGASSEQQPVTNTKPQNRAESKAEARPQGMVKTPTGDSANNTEVNPLATGKAGSKAQQRLDSRPQGMVKAPTGDSANNAEVNPVGSGKSANAGQARVEARNAKAAKKAAPQGTTPN